MQQMEKGLYPLRWQALSAITVIQITATIHAMQQSVWGAIKKNIIKTHAPSATTLQGSGIIQGRFIILVGA